MRSPTAEHLPAAASAVLAACLVSSALLAAAGVPPPAQPGRGRIEGGVRILVPAAAPRPSGVYPTRRVSRPAARASEVTNVVVFLKDITGQAALPTGQATIVQRDEAFVPRVVAITRGSTVDFPNADPFFHNVFSLAPGAAFDLGRYPRGETRSRRFTSAGLVKVYCHIHSHMTATIIVFDHAYFSIPSDDGGFAIEEVPAGTYRVSAWHERIGESISTVRVEAGRTARVEFALPVDTP